MALCFLVFGACEGLEAEDEEFRLGETDGDAVELPEADALAEEGPPIELLVELIAVGDDGKLTIKVERTEHGPAGPVAVAVGLSGDDGQGRPAAAFVQEVALGPLETAELATTVSVLGIPVDKLQFAATVDARASFRIGEGDALTVASAASEPLYFYPDAGKAKVVDEEGIANHGDFAAKIPAAALAKLDIVPSRIHGQPPADWVPKQASEEEGGALEFGVAVPDPSALPLAAGSHEERAATRVCMKWWTESVDSSINFRADPEVPMSLEEDWGRATGDNTWVLVGNVYRERWGEYWTARNAKFRLCPPVGGACSTWSFIQKLDSSGCANIVPHPATTSYLVEFRSEVEDSYGNHWKLGVFGTEQACTGVTPTCSKASVDAAQPYTIVTNATIPTGSTTNIYAYGSDKEVWSTTAFMGFSLYRLRSGLQNTTMGLCHNLGVTKSQNWANSFAEDVGCVQIGKEGGRMKYLVGHEIGHSVGYLYAGSNFDGATNSPHQDAEYERDDLTQGECAPNDPPNPTDPNGFSGFMDKNSNLAGDPLECYGGCKPYALGTYEWSALALREAFAHLFSTRVYNNWAKDAIFTWSSWPDSGDVVRFRLDADTDEYANTGGRMAAYCCAGNPPAGCEEGVGTIRDWTGALWNWYGSYWDEGCSGLSWSPDVMNVMAATLDSFNNSSQYAQAWSFFRAAVDQTSGVPACALSTWDAQGTEFGIDG